MGAAIEYEVEKGWGVGGWGLGIGGWVNFGGYGGNWACLGLGPVGFGL